MISYAHVIRILDIIHYNCSCVKGKEKEKITMSGANLQHLLAMILYMAAVVGIGIYFAGRANKDTESYFLGGRSLGPWVTAFSAEASDM